MKINIQFTNKVVTLATMIRNHAPSTTYLVNINDRIIPSKFWNNPNMLVGKNSIVSFVSLSKHQGKNFQRIMDTKIIRDIKQELTCPSIH